MKTFIIGLLLLGLSNLSLAQKEMVFEKLNSNSLTKSVGPVKNLNYTNTFSEKGMPDLVKVFHKTVADYDITTASIYTPDKPTTYTVVFEESKNKIKAVYNHYGHIISCDEKYEAIKLPHAISSKLGIKYPGWGINHTKCTIKYAQNKDAKIIFYVTLKKGNKSKTITVDHSNLKEMPKAKVLEAYYD